jgi:hypothetical protein
LSEGGVCRTDRGPLGSCPLLVSEPPVGVGGCHTSASCGEAVCETAPPDSGGVGGRGGGCHIQSTEREAIKQKMYKAARSTGAR